MGLPAEKWKDGRMEKWTLSTEKMGIEKMRTGERWNNGKMGKGLELIYLILLKNYKMSESPRGRHDLLDLRIILIFNFYINTQTSIELI